MLNYYLLGVLELRFRGGELCRGRGDGEHDSILYRVCVYEEISITQTFFFSFVYSGFFKDSLRVSKIQKNSYILNPPKMASICSISSVWLERAPNISRRQINSVPCSLVSARSSVRGLLYVLCCMTRKTDAFPQSPVLSNTMLFLPRGTTPTSFGARVEVLTCRVTTCSMFFFVCMSVRVGPRKVLRVLFARAVQVLLFKEV